MTYLTLNEIAGEIELGVSGIRSYGKVSKEWTKDDIASMKAENSIFERYESEAGHCWIIVYNNGEDWDVVTEIEAKKCGLK